MEPIDELKKAFHDNKLSLYLGAGVSVGNGLPTWDHLVLMMYYKTNQEIMEASRNRPYPNYLLAISEWLMEQRDEPLDVMIGSIRRYFNNEEDFLETLKTTLYGSFQDFGGNFPPREAYDFRRNETLDAVVKLCTESEPGQSGLSSIISYNYDDLVEEGTRLSSGGGEGILQPIYTKKTEIEPSKIPIFHVHGYIPYGEAKGSTTDELVLSEESYHKASQDAYYWGNMVQMNALSNNVGLMVGVSLRDRNIRRILAALKGTPGNRKNYIILKREVTPIPEHGDATMKRIHERANYYLDKFSQAGSKKPGDIGTSDFLAKIVKTIVDEQNGSVAADFEELGLHLIYVDDFSEIPEFLKSIVA